MLPMVDVICIFWKTLFLDNAMCIFVDRCGTRVSESDPSAAACLPHLAAPVFMTFVGAAGGFWGAAGVRRECGGWLPRRRSLWHKGFGRSAAIAAGGGAYFLSAACGFKFK